MAEPGLHKIQILRRRWMLWQIVTDVVLAVAGALVTGALLSLVGISATWCIAAFVVLLAGLLMIDGLWRVTDIQVASLLNKEYPELQEAAGLVLLPANKLNVLQSLALKTTEDVLQSLQVSNRYFNRRIRPALVTLCLAVFVVFVSAEIGPKTVSDSKALPANFAPAAKPEKVLPQIESVEVRITPPAYTRRISRSQDRFNLVIEDGALVSWHITTNIALKNVSLLFNDNERIDLKSRDKMGWSASRVLTNSGFYQVSIDGKLSDLYQVQVVKDAPPVIHVKSPRQNTYIDAGEAQRVNISAGLNDDYGISSAQIVATVAKGRGEGVKFKEYKLNFAEGFAAHKIAYNVQKLVDLPKLNMEPGDELYFYVQANDTHNQQSRSDVYTVTIQDTAELLSMNGMLTGSSIKPEFFRSERQIIIDAERLIKEKDSIGFEKFNNWSNDLGIDQKLLRLRYGKFLGEEGEDAIGKPDNSPAEPADFSNAAKILKEYTDDHDNAADATLFEPAIKAQLKATLTEMWKAELQLRLYKPQAALPFAYKALRLLKDLQQKSRSYVAKTGYNPPPLKPGKRLSGELDKVIEPVNKAEVKPVADKLEALKKAVPILEGLRPNVALTTAERRVLQQANQLLTLKASAQPGAYLPALGAMRRMLSAKKMEQNDISTVERAIQKTLGVLKSVPVATEAEPDMGLSKQYFRNLKQGNR
jgi:hypothetical protein